MPAPAAIAVRVETVDRRSRRAFDHRRIVRIRHHGVLRRRAVGFADHAEQAQVLRRVIDVPARIEYLVPAVLRVGLREHHQLDVSRVAAKLRVGIEQIVDLVVGQREAERAVGLHQRGAALLPASVSERHADQRARRHMAEQRIGVVQATQHRFGHAVVQLRRQRHALGRVQRRGAQQASRQLDLVQHAALDAQHAAQPAIVRNVGRLRRPGRYRAQPWRHQQRTRSRRDRRFGRQQRVQLRQFAGARCRAAFDEEVLRRAHFAHLADRRATVIGQTRQTRLGKGRGTAELQNEGHEGKLEERTPDTATRIRIRNYI